MANSFLGFLKQMEAKDVQNYENIYRNFDISTKNISMFAHFNPEIDSRMYTAIRYHRVFSSLLQSFKLRDSIWAKIADFPR